MSDKRMLKKIYQPKKVMLSEYDCKMILSALVTDALASERRWRAENAKPAEIAMGIAEYHQPFEIICKTFGINATFTDWLRDRRAKEAEPKSETTPRPTTPTVPVKRTPENTMWVFAEAKASGDADGAKFTIINTINGSVEVTFNNDPKQRFFVDVQDVIKAARKEIK